MALAKVKDKVMMKKTNVLLVKERNLWIKKLKLKFQLSQDVLTSMIMYTTEWLMIFQVKFNI